MATAKQPKTGYVKTQAMIGYVCLALVVGFFGGVTLTILKSGSTPTVAPPPGNPPVDNEQLRALQKELERHPDNLEGWARLGNLYFDAAQFAKAIEAYQRYLAIKPDSADILSDLGVMYRRNGQPQEAVKAFDRAIAAEPRHETARFNKGIVLLHDLNDREGALRSWEELLALNPNAESPTGKTIKELLEQFKQNSDS
jgi:cytochrome c-type biogenesis protein CcmH/NrfG